MDMGASSRATVRAPFGLRKRCAVGLRERPAVEDSWTMLEGRLAGEMTLRTEAGEVAPPSSRRSRAVRAYLAFHPGPHPRGRLAARFWPDVLDESARASLRVALTELRHALGPEARLVGATRETVALEGPGLEFDTR